MTTIFKKDLGIAILSTDRPNCLHRLLKSIQDHTHLRGLYVMVMDDSSDPNATRKVSDEFPFAGFIHSGERIGIAKNTNHAMKSLSPFQFKMILNNDVEILREGWEYFYPMTMKQTGIHHFCFQQEGLWGAATKKRPEIIQEIAKRKIKTIKNFPQGAIMAYDQKAFETVGYYDAERFKSYGRSHWLWSFSISESGIQPEGIHDVIGSNDYFKVHDEVCTTPQKERLESYRRNTKIFEEELQKIKENKRDIYIPYS